MLTAGVAIVALAGCTSGGDDTGSGSPSPGVTAPDTQSTPVPSTSAAPKPPIVKPLTTPKPVKRHIVRPPGAKLVDFRTCIDVDNAVLVAMEANVFAPQASREQQTVAFRTLGGLAALERPTVAKARRTWLAAGYPASFPAVRDIDVYLDLYTQLDRAGQAGKIDAAPELYSKLHLVVDQFSADVNAQSGPAQVCVM